MLQVAVVGKIVISALLLVLVGQTTGAISFIANCQEQCRDEDGGAASCLPGCPDCACCGLSGVLLRMPNRGPLSVPTVERVWPASTPPLAAPAPRDILHVPKSLLV